MIQEEKSLMLNNYHKFMNENVLKPIGVDYYDLLERELAIEAPEYVDECINCPFNDTDCPGGMYCTKI